MILKICLPLLLCFASAAFSRPKSVTVIFDEATMIFNSLELREQTTRALLPGCTWPDVLQGTGWFPATFYSSTQPTSIDSTTVKFNLVKRTALASYCGAVTDNVANSISFIFPIVETGRDAYGSIPFTLGTSELIHAVVECRYVQTEQEEHGQFLCDNASLAANGDLTISVRLSNP